MNHSMMADKMVSYADAITAFSIVSAVTFLLALTEQEVRCSLTDRSHLVYAAMFIQATVYSFLILFCHRTENRLRQKQSTLPQDLSTLRRVLICARVVVVLLATVGTIPLIRMALEDSGCV